MGAGVGSSDPIVVLSVACFCSRTPHGPLGLVCVYSRVMRHGGGSVFVPCAFDRNLFT